MLLEDVMMETRYILTAKIHFAHAILKLGASFVNVALHLLGLLN